MRPISAAERRPRALLHASARRSERPDFRVFREPFAWSGARPVPALRLELALPSGRLDTGRLNNAWVLGANRGACAPGLWSRRPERDWSLGGEGRLSLGSAWPSALGPAWPVGAWVGLGAGHAASAAWVAASREATAPRGVTGSPSFNADSGVTGGPATRSAWVSGIDDGKLVVGMKLNRQPLVGGVVVDAGSGRHDVASDRHGQLFDRPECGLFAGRRARFDTCTPQAALRFTRGAEDASRMRISCAGVMHFRSCRRDSRRSLQSV